MAGLRPVGDLFERSRGAGGVADLDLQIAGRKALRAEQVNVGAAAADVKDVAPRLETGIDLGGQNVTHEWVPESNEMGVGGDQQARQLRRDRDAPVAGVDLGPERDSLQVRHGCRRP